MATYVTGDCLDNAIELAKLVFHTPEAPIGENINLVIMFTNKTTLSRLEDALPRHQEKMPVTNEHFVNGNPVAGPFPARMRKAMFGLGCFWSRAKILAN